MQKEFDGDPHRIEIQQQISPEQSYQSELVGRTVLKNGQKLFRMDLLTLKIEEVDLQAGKKYISVGPDGKTFTKTKRIDLNDRRYFYAPAINMKNAAKKCAAFIEKSLGNDPEKIKQFSAEVAAQLQRENAEEQGGQPQEV